VRWSCLGRSCLLKGGVGGFGLATFALALLSATAPGAAISIQAHTQMTDADFVIGGGPHDLAPTSMAAGFYNGDNRSDLVVCSSENDTCWLFYGTKNVGKARQLSQPDITFLGPNGAFGSSANFIGDVNGDGLEDLAIGAINATGVGGVLTGGSLWVFFGRNDAFAGTVGYYDANTTIFGLNAGDNLGYSAAAAGDVNGDGFGDFWVSAPNRSDGSARVGAVFLFLGRASWPTELNEGTAALRLQGSSVGGGFGRVLLGAVDLNNDSKVDLLTSSSKYRDLSRTEVGAAFAFVGPLPTDGRTVNATRANMTFWGNSLVPTLGASLGFAPQFMKEPGRVVLIGAPVYSNNTSTGGGVYLFRIGPVACCASYNTWDAVGFIYTREANDQAGVAISAGCDIDHDGLPDLLIGAPNADVGNRLDAGRVFIVYGNDTSRQPWLLDGKVEGLEGKANRSLLGNLVLLADFNGDGWCDLIVGSPGDSPRSPQGGAVYGFVGRPRNRPPEVNFTVSGNLTEGSNITVRANISDPDDDVLTWTWSGAPNTGNSNNADSMNVTFPDDGTYTISVNVFDGTLHTVKGVDITVANLPPTCNFTVARPFREGDVGELLLHVSDPGVRDLWNVEWQVPPGVSTTGDSAVYQPKRGEDFQVNVTATDDDGGIGGCGMLVDVENVAPTVSIAGPTLLTEGDTTLYTATVSDRGTEDTFFYNWSGPEGNGNGTGLAFDPVRPGRFLIHLRVTDLDGGNGVANLTVTVLNVGPDVSLIMPGAAVEGETVDFQIKQYSGARFDPLTVSWGIGGGGYADGLFYRIARARPGTYNISVTVFDDDLTSVTFAPTFVVSNRAPLANVRVTPPAPYHEGQLVTFEAILGPWESSPPSAIRYGWYLDGEFSSDDRVFVLTAKTGSHKVGVRATDLDGGVSWVNRSMSAENEPPVVRITGDDSLTPGELGIWHANASDSSGSAVTITWTVDGEEIAVGPELKWSSKAPGTHVIRVKADDGSGGVAGADMTITVSPPPSTSAGIDLKWIAIPIGAAAAFAAGILLGAYVVGRIRERREGE
jgi:hypothetical protein